MASKEFKVATISSNRNSFGLRGVIVVARDGEAWQLAGNDLICARFPKDAVLRADPAHGFEGYEIPSRIKPDPPPELLQEIWPDRGDGEPVFVLAGHDHMGQASLYLLLHLTAAMWTELQRFWQTLSECRCADKGEQLQKLVFAWQLPLQWVTAGFVACLDQQAHGTPNAYSLPSVALRETGMVCYRRLPVELSEMDRAEVELDPPQLAVVAKAQHSTFSWGGTGLWTQPISWTAIHDCREQALRAPSAFDALCRP